MGRQKTELLKGKLKRILLALVGDAAHDETAHEARPRALTADGHLRAVPLHAHRSILRAVGLCPDQPVTSIVNTVRDLLTQRPVGSDIGIALAWCLGILVLAYIFAGTAYRRRIG